MTGAWARTATPRPGSRGRWTAAPVTVAIAALAATAMPAAGAAQSIPLERIHLDPRPGTPAVAASLVLPGGWGSDPEGLEGATRVLADAVTRAVRVRLGASVSVEAEVGPDRTTFHVLALGGRWRESVDVLLDAVAEPPGAALVSESVQAFAEVLRFESGAPVRDVQARTRDMLYGPTDPRSRAPDESSVRAVDPAAVADLQRSIWGLEGASLALVGGFEPPDARELLGLPEPVPPPAPDSLPGEAGEAVGDSAAVARTDTVAADLAGDAAPAGADTLADTFSGALAWSEGARIRIAQEVTSTWITAAYPVPDDAPATLLDFLVFRLNEEFNPTPPYAAVFSARATVRTLPVGRVLLVEVAVLPDATATWEARIAETVEVLARPADPEFFRWQRRRFRAAILDDGAHPEAAAARLASDLQAMAEVRDLRADLWTLTPARLAGLASALGPPRVLVYGPEL